MEKFEFMSPTKFILAKDAEQKVGAEVAAYSDKALLVHSGDRFMEESGLRRRVIASLDAAGVEVYEISGVRPNPELGPIREGIALCRSHDIGAVLAVGGGSVIDTAKTIGIGSLYDGDVWDFFTGKAHPERSLPVGAVMTLPATGSEASNGAVISNDGKKLDVMDDCIRPRFAIMNPEITYTLPAFQTACGITDIISHTMERYFTNSKNTDLVDRIGEAIMKSTIINAYKVLEDPRDFDSRAELMWASILSHNGLTGTGRNQDWSCHAIGAQLSAEYHSVHGATLSVIIPNWMEYVMGANIERFAQFARRVFDVMAADDEVAAREGIACIRKLYNDLNMPTTLDALGIDTDEMFDKMAGNATGGGRIGCIKPLSKDDVIEIYRMAAK